MEEMLHFPGKYNIQHVGLREERLQLLNVLVKWFINFVILLQNG